MIPDEPGKDEKKEQLKDSEYSETMSVYVTPPQKKFLEKKSAELKYPSMASFLRKCISLGQARIKPFLPPDNF